MAERKHTESQTWFTHNKMLKKTERQSRIDNATINK